MNRLWFFVSVVIYLAILNCSVVFQASLTGSVIDKEDDNPIAGATVLLYATKDNYANDLKALTNAVDTENAKRFYSQTQTDNDGSYELNGVFWEDIEPEYGKDGDRREVYIIIFHKEYELSGNLSVLTSGITNRNSAISLTRAKNKALIRGKVVDPQTNEGVQNVNVGISVPTSWEYVSDNISIDSLVFSEARTYTVVSDANGEYERSIFFPKMPDSANNSGTVIIALEFERNTFKLDVSSDSNFNAGDLNGDGIDQQYYLTGVITKDLTYIINDVYMKKTKFTETISGRVTEGVDNYKNGLTVKIWYKSDPLTEEADSIVKTQTRVLSGDNIQDGYFTSGNITWTDDSYTGSQSSKTVVIKCYDNNNLLGSFDVVLYSDTDNYVDLQY